MNKQTNIRSRYARDARCATSSLSVLPPICHNRTKVNYSTPLWILFILLTANCQFAFADPDGGLFEFSSQKGDGWGPNFGGPTPYTSEQLGNIAKVTFAARNEIGGSAYGSVTSVATLGIESGEHLDGSSTGTYADVTTNISTMIKVNIPIDAPDGAMGYELTLTKSSQSKGRFYGGVQASIPSQPSAIVSIDISAGPGEHIDSNDSSRQFHGCNATRKFSECLTECNGGGLI